jgi:hypothetical protein
MDMQHGHDLQYGMDMDTQYGPGPCNIDLGMLHVKFMFMLYVHVMLQWAPIE